MIFVLFILLVYSKRLNIQKFFNVISPEGPMTFREQKEMIEELREFEHKLSRDELEDFRMYLKRHKDDEELDAISMNRLKKLHEKYYINRPRKPFKDPFKK